MLWNFPGYIFLFIKLFIIFKTSFSYLFLFYRDIFLFLDAIASVISLYISTGHCFSEFCSLKYPFLFCGHLGSIRG